VRLCAFLDKPSRRQVGLALDFIGFTIPDVFVASYGADHAEKYRSLPDIVAVE
jgi:hypoxanthine phosphoribosyltransferase